MTSAKEILRSPFGTISNEKAQIDAVRMREYRLNRVRQQLTQLGYGGLLTADPINILYTTGFRNMALYMMRNPSQYVYIPVDGPIVLFDYPGSEHLAEGLETIDEVRSGITVSYGVSGNRLGENAKKFASEIRTLVKKHGGVGSALAIDGIPPISVIALMEEGIKVVDGRTPIERARAVKSEEEIQCLRISMKIVDEALVKIRTALQPGITENELWSILHQTNISNGGNYIDTRLLSSGPRTNPFFQEASDRVIQAGELVVLDTDTVGPFGYYADISRTFYCGEGEPTDEQRRLYNTAFEHIEWNASIIKPGMTFREFADKSWEIPKEFFANRYSAIAHGCGFSSEYPYIVPKADFDERGFDGVIEENMVLSVESYIGAKGGAEGVKLEQEYLVTPEGVVRFSDFPFEEKLLY
ncbi:Xaa-Pro peptidase family protein [Oceanobacillus sp. FSL K6-2867]|uniref:M24 family metallopeptidase n=1 Tax=Oceanobacillus sp. FSL K6-2867 TaxID=2954748 RepID=UPI0030DC1E8D